MTPDALQPASFSQYPAQAQAFATQHLPLLRQLPLSVCPSFLAQISALDTRFPAERSALQQQCAALEAMESGARERLLAPLRSITLPPELASTDWINAPAQFVERLSAALWASGQINQFHDASRSLFAALPVPGDDASDRLLLVVLGRGANASRASLMRRLAKQGLRLEALRGDTAAQGMMQAVMQRQQQHPEAYAHWYVDGGDPWTLPAPAGGVIHASYPQLSPLRLRVLNRMQAILQKGEAGAEGMRSTLAATSPDAVDGQRVSADPVLERFYTELFTESSGPQIFSTSFVQWTGRELARRVQPRTLLLRYAPRQHHRGFNEMVSSPETSAMDPEGSLVDAEMGAFYNWIEMNRISAPGRLTTLAWAEGSSRAVLIGPKTKPNTVSQQPITVSQALAAMQHA